MKRFVFLFFIFLTLVNCNHDGSATFDLTDLSGPCFPYIIVFSDDCTCEGLGDGCASLGIITREEYVRILEIQENSGEDCIYIQGVESSNDSFEGYLIDLREQDCP
ncbi:MAG: hypothetical protein ACON5F_07690 [Jejuia sp.]